MRKRVHSSQAQPRSPSIRGSQCHHDDTLLHTEITSESLHYLSFPRLMHMWKFFNLLPFNAMSDSIIVISIISAVIGAYLVLEGLRKESYHQMEICSSPLWNLTLVCIVTGWSKGSGVDRRVSGRLLGEIITHQVVGVVLTKSELTHYASCCLWLER